MKLHQIKLLADENISPKVVACLRQIGGDILDTKEQQWHGTDDETLLNIAYQEHRFVLTHDSDFGTLAVNQGKSCCGILYLRLKLIARSQGRFSPPHAGRYKTSQTKTKDHTKTQIA